MYYSAIFAFQIMSSAAHDYVMNPAIPTRKQIQSIADLYKLRVQQRTVNRNRLPV